MQPRQMGETSRPVEPSFTYFIAAHVTGGQSSGRGAVDLTPRGRWVAGRPLERPTEGLLRLVAGATRDREHAEVGGGQQLAGDVHPPLGEVPDGGASEHVADEVASVRDHATCGGFPCAEVNQVR